MRRPRIARRVSRAILLITASERSKSGKEGRKAVEESARCRNLTVARCVHARRASGPAALMTALDHIAMEGDVDHLIVEDVDALDACLSDETLPRLREFNRAGLVVVVADPGQEMSWAFLDLRELKRSGANRTQRRSIAFVDLPSQKVRSLAVCSIPMYGVTPKWSLDDFDVAYFSPSETDPRPPGGMITVTTLTVRRMFHAHRIAILLDLWLDAREAPFLVPRATHADIEDLLPERVSDRPTIESAIQHAFSLPNDGLRGALASPPELDAGVAQHRLDDTRTKLLLGDLLDYIDASMTLGEDSVEEVPDLLPWEGPDHLRPFEILDSARSIQTRRRDVESLPASAVTAYRPAARFASIAKALGSDALLKARTAGRRWCIDNRLPTNLHPSDGRSLGPDMTHWTAARRQKLLAVLQLLREKHPTRLNETAIREELSDSSIYFGKRTVSQEVVPELRSLGVTNVRGAGYGIDETRLNEVDDFLARHGTS